MTDDPRKALERLRRMLDGEPWRDGWPPVAGDLAALRAALDRLDVADDRWAFERDAGLSLRALADGLEARVKELERERDEANAKGAQLMARGFDLGVKLHDAEKAKAAAEAEAGRLAPVVAAAEQAWIRRDDDSMITLGRELTRATLAGRDAAALRAALAGKGTP